VTNGKWIIDNWQKNKREEHLNTEKHRKKWIYTELLMAPPKKTGLPAGNLAGGPARLHTTFQGQAGGQVRSTE